MNRRWLILLAFVLPGCAVGPDYAPPEIPAPAAFHAAGAGGTTADAPDPERLARWWSVFADARLDSLMDRAVLANLDLRIAQARVREARALRAGVAADGLPMVDAAASYSHLRRSENVGGFAGAGAPGRESDLFDARFDATWELDLFGRVRRGVEAAQADLEAADVDRLDTLVSLLAEVARNYVELRAFQRRLTITAANLAAQRQGLDLSRSRFDAGLTSELDVKQAEALVASTEADLPLLDAAVRRAAHRLAVLLALEPAALLGELDEPAPIPAAPATVAVGLPSDLLLRRPDIRRAERQLAAATARIGVATADLFPRVTLTGSLGLQADSGGELFDAGSRFWSLGPSVRVPLFEAGRIRANIAAHDARAQAALARYEQAALLAFEDAENAIIAYSREQTRRDALARALDASRSALAMSTELYTRGLTPYLTVLDSQRAALSAEDALAQSDRAVAVNLIALYKALGGGWNAPRNAPR